MHSKQGCMNQWTVCYSNAFWFGSTTYWSTQNLLRSILKIWGRFLTECVSLTSSWTPRELFALHIIWCGKKYSMMEYRSILPTSRDSQSSINQKRLSSCIICLALSTGLEAPFQTMPVKWQSYKNSCKGCQGQANSAKASKLSRISLVHGVTWMPDFDTTFSRVKEFVAHVV